MYLSDEWGYIVGSNNYADRAKVQVFHSTGNVHVEAIAFLFGAKDVNGRPNDLVHFRMYALDGEGVISTEETVNNAPSTVLGSGDVPIGNIDTTGFMVLTINPAVAVNGDFGVGFDVSDLGDHVELGLVTSSVDGPGSQVDQNWEQWSDGSWGTVSYSWQTDAGFANFDFAIAVVIGDGSAGIDDVATVNGMRMSIQGANPANTDVIVAYDMTQSANTHLVVMDAKGAKVVDRQLGRLSTGRGQTTLNVADWANGTYLVSLYADGSPITKKLVVSH
ncbi:MAG: T9SS type A sorting domain-containing protein [Flavobacteriales bacterium]